MMDFPEDSPGLAALEAALARDFARLNHPPADWVPARVGPDGVPMADVLIVGGGMCGLAAAFALRRLGISNLRQVDRREPGLEGPWMTYARMTTLRSPKHLTGPAMGLPNLTFRAWYEAQGLDWDSLDRIDRPDWMAYLRWYRRMTGAEVENGVSVMRIAPGEDHAVVTLSTGEAVCARRVVLATGREGLAAPRVPAPFAAHFGGVVRHSSDAVDFAACRGRRVAVIGLAASAFDNAAMALEAGAASVTLIGRAPAMPRLNKMKQTVYPGFTHGFAELPDAGKIALLDHVAAQRIAPPHGSVRRIAAHPRVSLLMGAEVTRVEEQTTGVELITGKGPVGADLVILGTGFAIDIAATPGIETFAGDILRWGDQVPGATGDWAAFPYLGDDFAFVSRAGSTTPGIGRLHCFNHAAQLSLGNLANDIPAVSEGAERLARRLAVHFFVEDRARHRRNLFDYAEPELDGSEWPGLSPWDPALGH
ncbi:MAG: NAD(P)/FAD-dependent oxidoreductase [Pseudomonadota bacterium]